MSSSSPPVLASAGINQQLSFTGKIVNSNGTNITDGTYNMEFKIYQDGNNQGTGSTLKWTEDWLVGHAGGITLTNGTFQVNLGAGSDSAALDSAVNWNQSVLWLSMQIGSTSSCTISTSFQTNCGGDTEMKPYIALTAVPQAFNAESLGGLSYTSFAQLSPGSPQTGSLNITNGLTIGSGQTVTVGSSTGVTGSASCGAGQAVTSVASTGGIVTTGPSCSAISASASLSSLSAATTSHSISNGDNKQTWQWSLTTAGNDGLLINESAASTATGSPSLVQIDTLASSTAIPLSINNVGSATAFLVQDNGVNALSVATSGTVLIGSATTDSTAILLQLDSYNTYDDSGITCTTNSNQGSFYYNTQSGSVRECQNGHLEDVVTTAALGLQLFGVVPDTGTNPGDLAGIVSGGGPCQVIWTAVNAVSVNSCTAFSGGRKVLVQSTSFAGLTGTSGQFRHICLNGTDSQPALSAAGTETANLPSWSTTSPILCLADIKFGGTNTMAAGGLYDLRTYTTTNKTFTTINQAVPYGVMIIGTSTAGLHVMSSAATGIVAGVVVASSGVAATNTINTIYAYSGPASVKATAGSLNAKVQTTTTAGYAITGTSTTVATIAGIAQNAWSNGCTSAATCLSSLFFIFSPR